MTVYVNEPRSKTKTAHVQNGRCFRFACGTGRRLFKSRFPGCVCVCMGRRESWWVFPISLFCDVEACGASTDVVSCVFFSSLRFLLHLVVNHARCPADELCRVPTIARVCRLDYTGSRVYSPLLFICWPPVNSVPPVIHE